jgi:DNA-directed RNA polymerase specialized sigma24 family protein
MGSITNALEGLLNSKSQETSAKILWDRYFERLCIFVEGQLYSRTKRAVSPEEIASDAFLALIDGYNNNRFKKVRNRDELWQMLTLIASRRAINAGIKNSAVKNGKGRVQGESALGSGGMNNLADFVQRDLGPADFAELQELNQRMLERLPNESTRQVALLRMAGYSSAEIAAKLGRVQRTVELKLNLIRKLWAEALKEWNSHH